MWEFISTYKQGKKESDFVPKLSMVAGLIHFLRSEKELIALSKKIADVSRAITDSDRCSVYIYDKKEALLRTLFAHDLEHEITVKMGEGIAGISALTKKPIIENNAYSSEYFSQAVDEITAYKTESILAVPILDLNGELLGLIQVLNKNSGAYGEMCKELLLVVAEMVKERFLPSPS